eukprot:10228036-Karenia_brevis.AAC.1
MDASGFKLEENGPATGPGKTGVFMLTAASNYMDYKIWIGAAPGITDGLYGIETGPVTGPGETGAHTLSASSIYMDYKIWTGAMPGIDHD